MLTLLRKQPIANQIMLVMALLCTVIFSGLTLFLSLQMNQFAIEDTERNLRRDLRVITGLLDYAYYREKERAENMLDSFARSLKGDFSLGNALTPTNGENLPALLLNNEFVNNNTRYTDDFKQLTGIESAILVKYNQRLFYATTSAKNAAGQSYIGKHILDSEEVEKKLLDGERQIVVARRGTLFFMISYKPIRDAQGQVIGAMSLRLNLNESGLKTLKEAIYNIKVGKTGYFTLLAPIASDDIGYFVIHPALEGQTIRSANNPTALSVAKQMLAEKTGMLRYFWLDKADNKSKEKIMIYDRSQTWGWVLGTGSFISEFVEDILKLRNRFIIVSIISAFITVFLTYWMVARRLNPLKPIVHAMAEFGAGNLAIALPQVPDDSHNELDNLAKTFNKSSKKVQLLIRDISQSAEEVSSGVDNLANLSDAILTSTQEQSHSASAMSSSVEEMSESINHVAENASQASHVSTEAQQAVEAGNRTIHAVIIEMEKIATELHASAEKVLTLKEKSNEIAGIVDVIRDIADQTNLLALNAAIEAARAGEAGRGFAVVADEVRQLAERTSGSTQEIARKIELINLETQDAADAMNTVRSRMNIGVSLTQQAGEVLVNINTHTEKNSVVAVEIADAMQQQSMTSIELAKRVEQIAEMAEKNTGLTEQNQNVAEQIQELANHLQNMVKQFKL